MSFSELTSLIQSLRAQVPQRTTFRVSQNTRRRTQKRASETQATISADEKPIRVAYGEQQLGAELIYIGKRNLNWIFHVRWCFGPINAYLGITVEGKALPGSAIITHYTGTTTQPVDPTLAAVIPGFTDPLIVDVGGNQQGIAHSVIEIPYVDAPDSINFVAHLQAMKVLDTRTQTVVYSTNPALHAYNMLTSPIYGPNWGVRQSSVNTLADIADQLVGGTKRLTSHMLIDRPANIHEWIAMMLDAAGAFINYDGVAPTPYKLVPNRPAAAVETFDLRTVSINNSEQVVPISRLDQPNVVRVRHTGTTTTPWGDVTAIKKTSEAEAGTQYPRVSVIRAPYIHDHRVANRLAVETINSQRLPSFNLTWGHKDDGVRLERGDVIALDTIPGFTTSKEIRVLSKELMRQDGGYFWRITGREHNNLMYSDEVVDKTQPPGIDVDDPDSPIAVNDLAISEIPWLDAGGTYQTQIKLTWTGVDHAQVVSYRVRVSSAGGANILSEFAVQSQGPGSTHTATSPAVEVGILYTVEVFSISSRSIPSAPDSQQITPTGDVLPAPGTTAIGQLKERLNQDQQGATHSAIEIDWEGSAEDWVASYKAVVVDTVTGLAVWEGSTPHLGLIVGHTLVTHSLETGVVLRVDLFTVNVEGDLSTASSQTITLVGRTAKPPDIPSLEAIEYDEYVELTWPNVLNPGDVSHRIKRGKSTDTWATASEMDRTMFMNPADRAEPTVQFRDYDVRSGTVKYFVKAIALEGLESNLAASDTLNIVTAKGSRAKERPRIPIFIEPSDPYWSRFNSATIAGHFGNLDHFEVPNDGVFHTALEVTQQAGIVEMCLFGSAVEPYVSGSIQIGGRIILDGRTIWEYSNDFVTPVTSNWYFAYCPIGNLFLDPVLNPTLSDQVGASHLYFPFNDNLKIEGRSNNTGSMTLKSFIGWHFKKT